MDQRRQERAPLDALVLPGLPAQRSAPPASRARLQHRELPAHAGFAERNLTVVADDAPRKTGQDRRPDRAPRPIRGVPAGRGGRAAGPVRQDPASHRRPAAIRRRSRHEEPERMNDCHPTDEGRAFVIRAQPIATQTPASGVQPRLRGVLAAGGGQGRRMKSQRAMHKIAAVA